MYNCYAIDDDEYSLVSISNYIQQHPSLTLIKAFNNSLEALDYINAHERVDLAILDIEMPEMNGIDLAKLISEKVSRKIFATSFTEYAYQAFEIQADAYLLKPFNRAKFNHTIERLFPSSEKIKNEAILDKPTFFFIKNTKGSRKLKKIYINNIISIEAQLHSIKIYLETGPIETNLSLLEINK